MNAAIIALIAATIISIIRVFSELLFVNPHQVRMYNRLMREWRQKAKEAMKRGDPKQIERVKREKAKIDGLTIMISKMRFKSMIVSLTASMATIIVTLRLISGLIVFVPLLGNIDAIWFLFLCSFACGSISSVVLKIKGYE